MNKSRRRLLFASAGAGAVAVVVSACGGGGGYSPPPPSSVPPPPPPPAGTCGATAIADNHGHMLTIPQADTMSMVSMTYNIQGIADHNHTITLTPTQLAQIGTKSQVIVVSTVGSSPSFPAHTHQVTVNCA